MDKLVVQNLAFSYGTRRALADVDLRVPTGGFVGVIGANGSGKSTLLKNIYRALTPDRGEILLDGRDIASMRQKAVARQMAVVGQENAVPFNFTVREIVAMGRTPYKRVFEPDNAGDEAAIARAMNALSIADLAERDFSAISGGEKQRVLLARAFAQDTDFLVLDEPTNHLDACFQMQIFEALRDSGKTVLAAIHDLNLAALFCDDLYVLDHGRIVLHGSPEAILTGDMIRDVFHARCHVDICPHTGKKHIVYIPSDRKTEGKQL